MMRRLIALSMAVLALGLLAGPVAAAKPARVALPTPPPEVLVFPAGTACAFDVHLEVLLNREYITTLTDRDGNVTREIVTGSLIVRLVNDDTGASVDLNVGGPGLYIHGDGTIEEVFLGRGLPIFDAIFYGSIGRHTFLLDDEYGFLGAGSATGRSFDVCALVA